MYPNRRCSSCWHVWPLRMLTLWQLSDMLCSTAVLCSSRCSKQTQDGVSSSTLFIQTSPQQMVALKHTHTHRPSAQQETAAKRCTAVEVFFSALVLQVHLLKSDQMHNNILNPSQTSVKHMLLFCRASPS
jgi:hypothetical protein